MNKLKKTKAYGAFEYIILIALILTISFIYMFVYKNKQEINANTITNKSFSHFNKKFTEIINKNSFKEPFSFTLNIEDDTVPLLFTTYAEIDSLKIKNYLISNKLLISNTEEVLEDFTIKDFIITETENADLITFTVEATKDNETLEKTLNIYALYNSSYNSKIEQAWMDYTNSARINTFLQNTQYRQNAAVVEKKWGDKNVEATGKGHYFIIDRENNRLWAFGYNNYGQLGLGYASDRWIVTENTFFRDKEILKLKTNTNTTGDAGQTLIQLKNGEFFTFGRNGYNAALGFNNSNNYPTPTLHPFFVDKLVKDFSTSVESTFVITKDNKLYVAGANNNYQLGLGDTTKRTTFTENTKIQELLETGETLEEIESGYNHTIIKTSNNRYFSFGRNASRQTGTGTSLYVTTPLEITTLRGINVKIFTEQDQSAALVLEDFETYKKGDVLFWGNNLYGNLGFGTTSNITFPQKSDFLSQKFIKNISFGTKKTLAIITNGKVFETKDTTKVFSQYLP